MGKGRVPMQVSPEFDARIKRLQQKIMKKQGEKISLRDLTERITKTIDFNKIEDVIVNNPKLDIKITLDRRNK